jgi:putative transposase
VITSNHIHLLVIDSEQDVIPKSLQLIAGRLAQEFNHRKERKGAFWEDRYHATAVEQNEHLIRCLMYIDLNMVRAGVVSHPVEWEWCGYNEIQNQPGRYGVIDRLGLQNLCGFSDPRQFAEQYKQWVDDAINGCGNLRESCWTESIAVGGSKFIEETKVMLGIKGNGRNVEKQMEDRFVLREEPVAFDADLPNIKYLLNTDNSYYLDTSHLN